LTQYARSWPRPVSKPISISTAVSYTAYSRFALSSLPLAHLERKYQRNNHDISTPEDIEELRAEPSKRRVIRLLDRILDWLDTWFLEPILICKRFFHVILLFSPIVIAVPIIFFGEKNPDEHDERTGTIWWYNLIMSQMELAGPTFIKVMIKIHGDRNELRFLYEFFISWANGPPREPICSPWRFVLGLPSCTPTSTRTSFLIPDV
jgi:hypothetical protein